MQPGAAGTELPENIQQRTSNIQHPTPNDAPHRAAFEVCRWMLGVGCWMLGVGCWVLGVGCWMFDVRCPSLCTDSLLQTGRIITRSPAAPPETRRPHQSLFSTG